MLKEKFAFQVLEFLMYIFSTKNNGKMELTCVLTKPQYGLWFHKEINRRGIFRFTCVNRSLSPKNKKEGFVRPLLVREWHTQPSIGVRWPPALHTEPFI